MATPSRSSGVASTVRDTETSGKVRVQIRLRDARKVMNVNGLPVNNGSAGIDARSNGGSELQPAKSP